jgi:hypothetical protein
LVDATTIVLLSNTIIMAITAAATIYRIKIEKIQTQIQKENAEYKKRIETFKFFVEKEKDEFLKMSPQEIYEMLNKVFCDADNS